VTLKTRLAAMMIVLLVAVMALTDPLDARNLSVLRGLRGALT
jgi:hypothetical protein